MAAAEGEDHGAGDDGRLRASAADIYERVKREAQEEIERPIPALALSGLFAGACLGFGAVASAAATASLGNHPYSELLGAVFFPVGFIVVIIGRAQLFTENTLYPVALVLSEKRELWNTLRLWCTVLPANVLGALAFATLAARTSALPPDTKQALVQLGLQAAHMAPATIFWSGVTAGWIIATAAWLVSGSHSITGSVMILWILTFVVGLGNFAHCIATSGEILSTVLVHQLPAMNYFHWLWIAVSGNVCGGVLMVTLLEYGQAILAKGETAPE
jgi:formate/nitrite transporter FocA (FNT family)